MLTTRNCIYLAKSKLNGKVYVGKTHSMLQERIRNHKSDSKKRCGYISRFYNHANKYGWDDIEWSILFTLPNQKELSQEEKDLLCQKEIEYISLYNARDRDLGFNIMPGGIARPFTSDSLSKNSNHMKERWRNPEYREQMHKLLTSDEHKQKIQTTRKMNGHIAKPKIKKIKQPKPKNIVYKITSMSTGKLYFGATTMGIKSVITRHKNDCNNYNSKFYKHIQTYGIDDLKYEVCEIYPIQEKLTKEQRQDLDAMMRKYIVQYNTEIDGLNTAPDCISDEVRKKIGEASRNRPEVYKKISEKLRGRKTTRKIVRKYKNSEEERIANLNRQKEKRKLLGAKQYQKYNESDYAPVIDLIKRGYKPRHILAKGVSQSLLSKAKRMMK